MGFNNPDVPWSEIERTLSDRKPGGDPHGWWSTGGARARRDHRPTDVPEAVLAQLGSRIQHQLRAHTPNDAKALRATVNTYPTSAYDDLGRVITSLGIGEAVVTVMDERGAPTPVAWTRLRAPVPLFQMPLRPRTPL